MARSTISSAVDASALLALMFTEQGAERFLSLAGQRPAMSTVNWSEVHQKLIQHGVDGRRLLSAVLDAGLEIMDLTVDRAERTADLWPATRLLGLSLGDRACLALALELRRPAVTADRSWSRLEIDGLDVHSLR
ncbi:MAG: type II toxin-antitoxin system VapC family toxin [Mycobacteriales bacterium]